MKQDLHVFETVKTKLKQCHGDGVMFSIVNKICVKTTCVVLSTCALLLTSIVKPCTLLERIVLLA